MKLDGAFVQAFAGMRCAGCGNGAFATAEAMKKRLEGALYPCTCGQRTPVEMAYYNAIATYPFLNVHFVSNWVWMRVAENVPLGKVYRIQLDVPLSKLHYVNASANASFPVRVAPVDPDESGFSLIAAAHGDVPPEQLVRVAWTVAGYRGPERPIFIEAISRAFELLFKEPLRSQAMIRGALLEAAGAYEIFAAWYLRNWVWTDSFFAESKNKSDQVADLIQEAGIFHLTQVPIRMALSSVDLYATFRALALPAVGGVLTRDGLIQDVLTGIRLRNQVAHKGLADPKPEAVESFIRAVYFIMEAVMFNVAWETMPPPAEMHADVAR
jgi:hypothetical protein